MPDNLYYTQSGRGFQQKDVKYTSKSAKNYLKRTKYQCQYCGSEGNFTPEQME